jgi:hypothetical protein
VGLLDVGQADGAPERVDIHEQRHGGAPFSFVTARLAVPP